MSWSFKLDFDINMKNSFLLVLNGYVLAGEANPSRRLVLRGFTGWWDVHVSIFGQFSIWLSVKFVIFLKSHSDASLLSGVWCPWFCSFLFLCSLSWLWRELLMWPHKMFLKFYTSNLISQIPTMEKNQILPIRPIEMLWPLTNGKWFMG